MAVTLNTIPPFPLSTYPIFFNVPSRRYQHNRGEYRPGLRRRYATHLGSTLTPTFLLAATIAPIGDQLYSRSAPNDASQVESGFVDSSGPIFSMYMELAEEEDKNLAESWQADADSILIFVRLYFLVSCLTPTHRS